MALAGFGAITKMDSAAPDGALPEHFRETNTWFGWNLKQRLRQGCKKVHNFYERIALKKYVSSASVVAALIALLLSAPAGASTKSKAATLFEHYSNVYMYAAFNRGMAEQNSSNPTTSTAGINLEIAAINRFDNHIRTIQFPKSDKSALNKVLLDDSVWVSLDGTLALNTSNTSNYNSLFDGVQTAQANATAAIHVLDRDLGLTY